MSPPPTPHPRQKKKRGGGRLEIIIKKREREKKKRKKKKRKKRKKKKKRSHINDEQRFSACFLRLHIQYSCRWCLSDFIRFDQVVYSVSVSRREQEGQTDEDFKSKSCEYQTEGGNVVKLQHRVASLG